MALEFKIGADPEFFLSDSDGNLKSAIPIIEGTKDCQIEVEGGGLQRDNVAAEFSCEPQESEEGFVKIIGTMLTHLTNHIKPLQLCVLASTDFPKAELDNEEAQQFGCSPDYDCYELRRNEMDDSSKTDTLRSCGGHIHVGVKNGLPKTLAEDDSGFGKILAVKAMDFFVGICSIVLDQDKTAPRRRKLYGKAGCHRPTEYGVEYRAVGNFWTNSPETVRMIYRLTAMAMAACDDGTIDKYLAEVGEKEVQRIINESDAGAAKKVISKYVMPHMKPETKELFEKCTQTLFDINKEWSLL